MNRPELPPPPPAEDVLRDEVIGLRLLHVLGPADAERRPPEARFMAAATECRFAIHRIADGVRVGRIHLRLTDDATILRAVGHGGYEVDEAHRRQGYAARALLAIRRVARHYGVAPLWVLVAPGNVASRRTAERAGLVLVDTTAATPEALALGLEPELCRYVAERP
jgi:predicted acetyltransferase